MKDSVAGVVVHIRKKSKKLMFVDIETDQDQKRITVVFKSWENSTNIVDAVRGESKIHPGDEVVFRGYYEDESTFSAAAGHQILKLWSQDNPDTAFIPKPPSDNKSSSNHCKEFINTGQCSNISHCSYLHPDDKREVVTRRLRYVRDKKQRQLLVHENSCDQSSVSSSQRARVFAEWILETYGHDQLQSGVVLDIAGGRGDLSFELSVKHGVKCIIVDPRPQKFRKWQLKILKKNPELQAPQHIQDLFDDNLLQRHDVDPDQVKLVVGLHPDEATEPLVDTALHLNINFAVIPCCVFSAKFPDRRMRDDSEPVSYEQFCDYLREKSQSIKYQLLPFLGRNKVLYNML